MNTTTRLRLSGLMILVSAVYAVLVAQDQDIAKTVAVGYIAVLLTVFVSVNFWKSP